jgi:protease-4
MRSFFKTLFASALGFVLGAFLLSVAGILVVGGIISGIASDPEVKIEATSILHFKPGNAIRERSDKNPLNSLDIENMGLNKEPGLNDILAALRQASADKRIKGMYLELSPGFSSGFSTLQEIRDALLSFRDSGKFIVAYADFLSEPGYFLASAADKIFMNPAGEMLFNGLYADVWFYKGALEKLGVEVQVFKHGKFKSAVEPYLLDRLSPENRVQMERYVSSIYRTLLDQISSGRDIPVKELDEIASELKIQKVEDAVSYRMIDGLLHESEVFAYLNEKIEEEKDNKLPFVRLAEYSKANPSEKNIGSERIAVLYATGAIQSTGGGEGVMNAEEMIRSLREIRKDTKTKALVLRVNSPGGSALASDRIYHELLLVREKMPVIVSMGDVAASGGYFIACAGDTILAQKNTITGSIGVFGLLPNMSRLLNDKLGITVDGVKTGKYADLGRVDRPVSPQEREIIQKMVDRTYTDFVDKVAKSRKKDFASIDSIAEGRVWTGEDALSYGLVDLIGGMETAVRLAAEKSGLEKYRVVEYPAQKNPFENLFGDMKTGIRESLMKEDLGPGYDLFQEYRKAVQMQGVQMRMPYELHIH